MIPEDNPYQPAVGDWYKNSLGQTFEVVAIDEDEETVEVQFYDGEVEEYEMETWRMLEIIPAVAPKDWSAPYDDIDKDDLGYHDAAVRPADWSNPLDDVDRLE